jgi:hypothetical protein
MPNFFPAKPSSSHGHPAIIENQEKVIPHPVAKILSISLHLRSKAIGTVLEFSNNLWGTRNRVGIELPYWLARLEELIPWNRFLGSLKSLKFGLWICRENQPKERTFRSYITAFYNHIKTFQLLIR